MPTKAINSFFMIVVWGGQHSIELFIYLLSYGGASACEDEEILCFVTREYIAREISFLKVGHLRSSLSKQIKYDHDRGILRDHIPNTQLPTLQTRTLLLLCIISHTRTSSQVINHEVISHRHSTPQPCILCSR